MKKLITIFILLFSITTFSQNEIKNDSVSKTESFETIVKSYLTKTLDFVEQEGKKVYDLASIEIPEIIKQYLLFESFSYGFWFLIGIMLLLFGRKITNKLLSIKSNLTYDDIEDDLGDGIVIYIIIRGLFIIGGILFTILNIIPFVKVTFMPKLYLVEKFINIL